MSSDNVKKKVDPVQVRRQEISERALGSIEGSVEVLVRLGWTRAGIIQVIDQKLADLEQN